MGSAVESVDGNVAALIGDRLGAVRLRIDRAARRAGRNPKDITLVAVSKTRSFPEIEAAFEAGQRDFGENRIEELWEKVEQARSRGVEGIRWHLIGTIQSRKCKDALGPFALIHAVDRVKIARRLDRFASEVKERPAVLLEVNVSGEATKHGFSPDELRHSFAELLDFGALTYRGLMTMAPFEQDPETTRPYFRQLRLLRDELQRRSPRPDSFEHLSMGMSNDYEVAIEEGSTIVRVGTAIFGERS